MVLQTSCGQLGGIQYLIYTIHSLSANTLMGIKLVLVE